MGLLLHRVQKVPTPTFSLEAEILGCLICWPFKRMWKYSKRKALLRLSLEWNMSDLLTRFILLKYEKLAWKFCFYFGNLKFTWTLAKSKEPLLPISICFPRLYQISIPKTITHCPCFSASQLRFAFDSMSFSETFRLSLASPYVLYTYASSRLVGFEWLDCTWHSCLALPRIGGILLVFCNHRCKHDSLAGICCLVAF